MKWPREYAREIISKPVSEWRGELEKVPPHFKKFIRDYLKIEFMRRKHDQVTKNKAT